MSTSERSLVSCRAVMANELEVLTWQDEESLKKKGTLCNWVKGLVHTIDAASLVDDGKLKLIRM